MKNLSLSQKAGLAFALIILPIAIAFIYSYQKNRVALGASMLENLTVIAEAYEGQVYQFLEMNRRRAEGFASDGRVVSLLEEIERGGARKGELGAYLREKKITLDRAIQKICVIGLDGIVISSTDEGEVGRDHSGREYFRRGLEGTSILESTGDEPGDYRLVVSAPVRGERKSLLGVIVNFMELSELDRLMTGEFNRDLGAISWTKGRFKSMEAYLVNRERLMITSSIFVEDAVMRQAVDTLPVAACLESTEEVSAFYPDYRGVPVAGASMCLPSLGWTLLVEYDEEELFGSLNFLLRSATATGIMVAGLVAILYIFFVRGVVRPLGRLTAAAGRVAEGDYGVALEPDSTDEIGALKSAFNRMAEDVRRRTGEFVAERNRAEFYFDVAGVMILALDRDGRISLINRQGCRTLGYDDQCELTGLDWFENFVPERARSRQREYFNRLVGGREAEVNYYYENPINTRFGEERIFAWHNTTLVEEDGVIVGTLSSGEDITARKASEAALARSEEKYRTLFEESKDSIFICSADGGIIDANPSAVETLGFASKEDLIAAGPGLYEEPGAKERLLDLLRAEGFAKDYELDFVRSDGRKVYGSISATVIRDVSGEITGFRGIMRDMTEHKRLEEQLLQSQKMEAIGQLTGGIAHDFNNMLTAMTGYSNILEMKLEKDDPLRQYVRQMLSAIESAANLTHGLLAFSRKQVMNIEPMNLNESVRNVERLLKRLIGEDVEMTVSCAEGPLVVMADSVQIEQVLMNLGTNARDAMPGGGSLSITTGREVIGDEYARRHGFGAPGEYAALTISDTGEGMDNDTLKKVFEPFFTTKELGKGTGLGLAIVYGIIKQLNGYINVYSEPGTGTTFRIYLPAVRVDGVGREGREELEGAPGGTETVLVAEDNADVREITRSILEEFGYTVIEAADGEEAVETFRMNRERIDLLVLDVIMPRKNGREAYEEIKRLDPGAKVLFTSGYTDDVIHRHGVLDRGLNYLQKPAPPTVFLRKVREVIDG